MKPGDWVICIGRSIPGQFTAGRLYLVSRVREVSLSIARDDQGSPNGWGTKNFKKVKKLSKLDKVYYGIE